MALEQLVLVPESPTGPEAACRPDKCARCANLQVKWGSTGEKRGWNRSRGRNFRRLAIKLELTLRRTDFNISCVVSVNMAFFMRAGFLNFTHKSNGTGKTPTLRVSFVPTVSRTLLDRLWEGWQYFGPTISYTALCFNWKIVNWLENG